MELLDVIGSGNIHRCREIQPFEATIYGLKADKLETFTATGKIELTLAVDGTSEEGQQKNKKQFSSLKIPVGFSKESVSMVRELSTNRGRDQYSTQWCYKHLHGILYGQSLRFPQTSSNFP